jgi:hypothetical protein
MKAIAILLGCLLLFGFKEAQAQLTSPSDGPFSTVPLKDLSYSNLATLYQTGILAERGTASRPTMTRYEFAVLTQSVLTLLQLDKTIDQRTSPWQLEPQAALRISILPRTRAGILDLMDTYKVELGKLGVDIGPSQSKLLAMHGDIHTSSAVRQQMFNDVPWAHWARASVDTLRISGVLIGYPSSGDFSTRK